LKNSPTTSTLTQPRPFVRWIAFTSWVFIVLANLTLFLFDQISDYADMLRPCADTLGFGGECNFLAISSAEVAVLTSWGWTLQTYAVAILISPIILLLVYWTLAGLILWRQGTNWFGLVVSLGLIILPMATVSGSNDWSGTHPILFFLAVMLSILGNNVEVAFLYLLPNGRFSPKWAYIPMTGLILLLTVLALEINGIIPDYGSLWETITVGLILFGGGSQIYRYMRDANRVERQQTKWIIFGIISYVLSVMLWIVIFGGVVSIPAGTSRLLANLAGWTFINAFSLLILPVAITIAILRYKLWNIDLIINRTLVYGGLTLLITAVYLFLVGGIGALANQSGQTIGLVLATVIVAAAVRPLHRSLQTTANRFVSVPDPPANGGFEGKQTTEATGALPPPSLPLPGGGAKASLPAAAEGRIEGGRLAFRESVPRSRWLAGGLFTVAMASQLALGWLAAIGCSRFSDYGPVGLFIAVASGLAFSLVGSLILFYRPHNRVGWLCLWSGIGLPTSAAIDIYVFCGLAGHITAPGLAYLAWFTYSFGVFLILPAMFILLPMLYPNGQFLSPRWRWLTLTGLVVLGLAAVGMSLLPDFSRDNSFETFYPIANPFGLAPLPAWWYSVFSTTSSLTVLFLSFAGISSMIVRLKRSVGDERQQMKWLAYFLATAVVVQLLFFEIPGAYLYPWIFDTIWYELIVLVVFFGFPLIIGLTIFKYRLYAIDLVINRTLVYGGLTLVVVLIYAFTVGLLSLLFQNSGSLTISLIATGLIALAFHPVRERLQRGVNRLMFGERDDPYAVLSHLGQQLQTTAVPAETLAAIVETIAGTLKLPYAAIELIEQEKQIGQAAVGEPVGDTVELPLRYQKETVGRLLVSPRAPGEKFTAKEQQLLADIAAQTGPVASATRLTLALQRSREKLVLAREEERRRIRRDLHDGLGPSLASQTLKLDTVLDLLANDPQTAGQHVKQLKSQTQQMVADIRRLVYELRPPALDELGLLEALRAHVAQMNGTNGRLRISIEAVPEPLPALPAAIEVAAYRIALEGVTNVIRHAQARDCRVRFIVNEDEQPPGLIITVTDDGLGLPAKFQSGVGLTSMRERAEELGGACTVRAAPNRGTRIRAVLPFSINS